MSALSTAAIIGLTAAAGAQVAGAAIGSKAAGKAADTQSASAADALKVQQQVYQDQQKAQAPYMQLGAQAAGKLGSYQTPTTAFNPNNFSGGAPVGAGGAFNPATASPWGPSQIQPSAPAQASLSQMGSPMQTAMARKSGADLTGGGTVKLRAPNGEVSDVPANQEQHFLQLGATRMF